MHWFMIQYFNGGDIAAAAMADVSSAHYGIMPVRVLGAAAEASGGWKRAECCLVDIFLTDTENVHSCAFQLRFP